MTEFQSAFLILSLVLIIPSLWSLVIYQSGRKERVKRDKLLSEWRFERDNLHLSEEDLRKAKSKKFIK